MTPMHAERLEVRHDDDRVSVYENVHYRPRGASLDIVDADGVVLRSHPDVLTTIAGQAP